MYPRPEFTKTGQFSIELFDRIDMLAGPGKCGRVAQASAMISDPLAPTLDQVRLLVTEVETGSFAATAN